MEKKKFKSFEEVNAFMDAAGAKSPSTKQYVHGKTLTEAKAHFSYEKYMALSLDEKKKNLNKRGITFSYQTVKFLPETNCAVIHVMNPFTGRPLVAEVIPSMKGSHRKTKKDGSHRIMGHLKVNTSSKSAEDILVFVESGPNVSGTASKKQKKQIQKIKDRGIIAPRYEENAVKHTTITTHETSLYGATWEELDSFKEDNRIYFNDFVTTTDVNQCTNNKHEIEPINALIFVLRKDGTVSPHKIPASYCRTCKRYYISRWQYENVCEYGKPLCQLVKQYFHKESQHGSYYQALNAESKLHISGYNVGATEDLSEIQRHTLLTFLIESEICKKHEINSHLSWLIKSRQGQLNMANAVEKWKKDRDFVDSYKMGSNRTVGVRLIRHKKYICY